MATLSEYFEAEAQEALTQVEAQLDAAHPDTHVLHRAVRALRGTAQLARAEPVVRVGTALEAMARALAAGELSWSDELRRTWRESVADLRTLVTPGDDGDDEERERLAASAIERIRKHGPAAGAQEPRAQSDPAAFMRFAAQEVGGIVDVLDRAIQQLAVAPMDREPLKAVLRRQRALLGAARIEELPVVAEILRGVDDLTRIVARLDVGVKQEWFDVYRVARDGLRHALEALRSGAVPGASNASSRLRHMRQELTERYGAGDAAAANDTDIFQTAPDVMELSATEIVAGPAPHAGGAGVPHAAAAGHAAPASSGGDASHAADDAPDLLSAATSALERAAGVVPVEDLLLSREDALRQALTLRDTILRATAHDEHARAAAEELFDLLRHAAG